MSTPELLWRPAFGEIPAHQETKKIGMKVSDPLAIPGSVGELVDKITILEVKEVRVKEVVKLDNIRFELKLLRQLRTERGYGGEQLAYLEAELKATNERLWDIESALREHEARSNFGAGFVALARQVYITNDRRAALKKEINDLFNSAIIEEKSYTTSWSGLKDDDRTTKPMSHSPVRAKPDEISAARFNSVVLHPLPD